MTATELIEEIKKYKEQKENGEKQKSIIEPEDNNQIVRLIVGLSGYPDGSNLKSSFLKYKAINEVAFFSQKEKPDLYFVLALLFGSMNESYDFITVINSKRRKTAISWQDVYEYLAEEKNYYFVNYNHNSFSNFISQFSTNTVKCLITSMATKMDTTSYPCLCVDAANIIHPSTFNLNIHTRSWIKQYITTSYVGPIDNSILTYQDFQL